MRNIILAILVLSMEPAAAAELDIYRCAELGGRFKKNPVAMPMGELVELMDCLHWVIGEKNSAAAQAKSDRAIVRNFSKDAE